MLKSFVKLLLFSWCVVSGGLLQAGDSSEKKQREEILSTFHEYTLQERRSYLACWYQEHGAIEEKRDRLKLLRRRSPEQELLFNRSKCDWSSMEEFRQKAHQRHNELLQQEKEKCDQKYVKIYKNKPLWQHVLHCIQYFDTAIPTLSHECGHALMAKIVNNSPFDIHIGALPQEVPHEYRGKKPLTIHSFKMNRGFALHKQIEVVSSKSKLKKLAVLAAGPLAGIASLCGMYYATDKIFPVNSPYGMAKYFVQINLGVQMFSHVLYGFTPFYQGAASTDGDGSSICELLGVNKEWLKKVADFDSKGVLICFFAAGLAHRKIKEMHADPYYNRKKVEAIRPFIYLVSLFQLYTFFESNEDTQEALQSLLKAH